MVARFAPLAQEDPQEVSGYTLRARLGGGGMGRVYLSFTPGGRALAIKVIRPEYAEDEEFRRRFEREVTAAQRVQGLFTAPVVDADPTAALPWLAIAYVPGPSLQQAVAAHGPLPHLTVFRLLAGVAEGLAAVHACGIIHRDLKPANVLLADDGPRVIDFGIAHAAEATALTRTGLSVGTPAFMAPEQIRGRSAVPATDVFGLGHLTVFAATGHAAFGEGNQDALLYRIIHDDPALADCPPEVRDIALRCLAKEPAERPELTEVMAYARERTSGQTLQLAGSWLPAPVADSLTAYDVAAYRGETNRLTKPVAATAVDRPVALPVNSAPPFQQPYPQPVYPQAPYPQPPAPTPGVAAIAMMLCTVTSLFLVWSAISVLTGSPPVASSELPPGVMAMANWMWTIGDILVISGTILLWRRKPVGRVLAIIGLCLVLTAMLGFEIAALSAPHASVVRPLAYFINVFTVLSLVFVLLPGTDKYLKAGRMPQYAAAWPQPYPQPGYPPRH